jgi:hypothetical protein
MRKRRRRRRGRRRMRSRRRRGRTRKRRRSTRRRACCERPHLRPLRQLLRHAGRHELVLGVDHQQRDAGAVDLARHVLHLLLVGTNG